MPVEPLLYPANLVVEGRRCLVVGGGKVARRKVEGLVACGAVVTVIAPEVDDWIAGVAASVHRRAYAAGDVAGFRLVIAATGDPEVDRAIYDEADAAGIWVNAADEPQACSFTLPAVVRRGPIMVTVSTGGHSPALAVWLRSRIEDELGPEYGALLELLSEERAAIQAAGRSTEGLDWISALDSNMLDLIRAGRIREARERLRACLSSS